MLATVTYFVKITILLKKLEGVALLCIFAKIFNV